MAALALGVVLVLGLPLLVLVDASARPSLALGLQLVVVGHAGAGLTRVVTDPAARVGALGFWAFTYVWLGLAPLAMLARETFPLAVTYDAGTAAITSLIIEVGLLAYAVGSWLGGFVGRGNAARTSTARTSVASENTAADHDLERELDGQLRGPLARLMLREFVGWRVVALGLCAIALAIVVVPRLGGLGSYFMSRQAKIAASEALSDDSGTALTALITWTLSVVAFWALLALAYSRPDRAAAPVRKGDATEKGNAVEKGDATEKDDAGGRWRRIRRRVAWTALFGGVLAVNVVVNNPISQPRYWVGTAVLAFVFGAAALRRPRPFTAAALALVLGLAVAFPYTDYFRYDEPEPLNLGTLADQYVGNGDYDAYQQMQTGVDFVRERGLAPELALGPPLFFVPRAVWPDKPDDAGAVLGTYAGYTYTNLSSPLWIETYLWGGLPMVALAFLLLGLAQRRVDDLHALIRARAPGGVRLGMLLVPTLAIFQLILLRGSLLQASAPLALLVGLPLLLTRPAARVLEWPRRGDRLSSKAEGSMRS